MKEPMYKPEVWVRFQQEQGGGYGRIIGAAYHDETWHYTVAGAVADGSHLSIREDEITSQLQSGSWVAPSISGGGSSAYVDAQV